MKNSSIFVLTPKHNAIVSSPHVELPHDVQRRALARLLDKCLRTLVFKGKYL